MCRSSSTAEVYRDLPIRLAEFGNVHRYEPSGALHGLMRVRGFTQDDAHVFCTEEQLAEMPEDQRPDPVDLQADFGFDEIVVKLSTRPEKRVGTDALWDHAEEIHEAVLEQIAAIRRQPIKTAINPGEGAFYGPKFEYVLRDAIGRDWQCGTTQVDFNLPERFGAFYIGADGEKKQPVMVHRAICGSMERFLGILIENFAGHFPLLAGAEAGGGLRRSPRTPTTMRRSASTVPRCPCCWSAAAGKPSCAARIGAGCAPNRRSAQREDQLQGARAQRFDPVHLVGFNRTQRAIDGDKHDVGPIRGRDRLGIVFARCPECEWGGCRIRARVAKCCDRLVDKIVQLGARFRLWRRCSGRCCATGRSDHDGAKTVVPLREFALTLQQLADFGFNQLLVEQLPAGNPVHLRA
jgi:hypothetical protein